ncbi:MAG TPA: hypothetical protein VLQ67_08910, partial [Arachnia sp.]|nr:hypothetical protein [Arachnia sp.]
TGRAVSFLAPLMFGLMIAVGVAVTGDAQESSQHWGILGVVLVLLAGFIVALFVKQPRRSEPAQP